MLIKKEIIMSIKEEKKIMDLGADSEYYHYICGLHHAIYH